MGRLHYLKPIKFRIVVLDSPYDSLNSSEAQKFFSHFVDLKLRGYGCEYPYGIMPVDTTDFLATHLGVFMEKGNEIVPVAAFKTISERKCKIHGVPFSGLQVPGSSGAHDTVKAVEHIVERSRSMGSFLTYEGSWTFDPAVRKDPQLAAEIYRICTCMHVNQHLRYGKMDSLCCGLLRFKTDRIMKGLGYDVLTWQGREVQPFAQASLKGEMVLMHHATEFSNRALRTAEQYRDYWDNRIEIGRAKMEQDITQIIEQVKEAA
jgi:hypothetical protein